MAAFKPGWYEVSRDRAGTKTCRYFQSTTLVVAECHLTQSGLQILHWTHKTRGHENGLAARWQANYGYLPNEAGGTWDNEQSQQPRAGGGAPARAAAAPARGTGAATTGPARAAAVAVTAPRSTSPCDDITQTCKLCDRRGLLIFPALYAAARADVMPDQKAPALAAPFGSHLSALPLPGALAQYTLRTVRPGYIYVFNQRLGAAGWKGYQVSANGYLFEFDLNSKAPPPEAPTGNPCGRRASAQAARCIAIADARTVGDVYLTFTDTAWTPDTLAAFKANRDGRQAKMRKLDGAAWVSARGNTTQPHVASAPARLGDVSEFALLGGVLSFAMPFLNPTFSDSLTKFNSLQLTEQNVRDALAIAGGGVAPALVALDDPTGIAADLNQQTFNRMLAWYEQPDRKWKRESAHTLTAVREAVKNGAVESARNVNQAVGGVLLSIMPAHAGPFIRGNSRADKYGNLRYVSEEQQDKLGAKEWAEDHLHLYRHTAVDTYLNEAAPSELQSFESVAIAPLDQVFCQWLQSDTFVEHFEYHFDRRDPESGEAYALKMSVVLNNAAGRRGVWDYIDKQLDADPTQPKSLILRALVLNQDQVAADWGAAVAGAGGAGAAMQLDPFKWDKISEKTWSAFKKIAKTDHYKHVVDSTAVIDRAMNAVVRFTNQILGPVLHKVGAAFDQAAAWTVATLPQKRLMGLMGTITKAGNPNLMLVDFRGAASRQTATRMLAGAIAQFSKQDNNQYRSVVRGMLDEAEELRGTRYTYNGIALIDRTEAERLKDYAAGSLKKTRAELVSSGVMELRRADNVIEANSRTLFGKEVKINMAATFFTALTWRSALADMRAAGSLEKKEKIAAFAGACASLAGAAIELVGGLLASTPWGAIKYAKPMKFFLQDLSTRAKAVGFAGKVLGAAGSFITAWVAGKDGYESLGVNALYGGVMIVLGISSFVLGLLTLLGYTGPWGVALALIIAAIYLVIGFFKPTKVQKWLNASYWGQHNGNKEFKSHTEELEALQDLAKA
jgi:hypothetical protein